MCMKMHGVERREFMYSKDIFEIVISLESF